MIVIPPRAGVGAGSGVLFHNSFAPISNTNSFSTTLSQSGTIDLSPYAGIANPKIVVALNWYANGGGLAAGGFLECKLNSVDMTLMGQGGDRSAGNNWGAVLYIITPSLVSSTLLVSQNGTSNTGRNIWASAWLFSNVGGYSNVSGFYSQASGTSLPITCGVGDWAVNTINGGASFTSYNQTQRQTGNVGNNMRAICGDAQGDASGTKTFIATGPGYQSVGARLYPAAA